MKKEDFDWIFKHSGEAFEFCGILTRKPLLYCNSNVYKFIKTHVELTSGWRTFDIMVDNSISDEFVFVEAHNGNISSLRKRYPIRSRELSEIALKTTKKDESLKN